MTHRWVKGRRRVRARDVRPEMRGETVQDAHADCPECHERIGLAYVEGTGRRRGLGVHTRLPRHAARVGSGSCRASGRRIRGVERT